MARSARGVARPIFYKGEQVGEWRHYDERLTMFLLKSRRQQRYGKWIDRSAPPEWEESASMKLIRITDDFKDELSPEDFRADGDDSGSSPDAEKQP